MIDMEPIVSHGEPSERSGIYENFFTTSDKKRILLITYDTLFRDLEPAVVKDKSFKPDLKNKKLLKEAREKEKDLKDKLEKKMIQSKRTFLKMKIFLQLFQSNFIHINEFD
jgi:hypothetical protein